MKFAIAVHGTRGDVEPCAAVALELIRRGHEVRMAVPPNLVDFVKSAGITSTVPYGPDSGGRALSWGVKALALWSASHGDPEMRPDADHVLKWWRLFNPINTVAQLRAYLTDGWSEMSDTVVDLAHDADLILTGMTYQEVAANVAEFYLIPFAAMHYCPIRPSSETLPIRLPSAIARPIIAFSEWVYWRVFKPAEDAQRAALGLPQATQRSQRRIEKAGALEIQAYDKVFYPRLASEWGGNRPLIGSVTLRRPVASDADVLSWIDSGSPPVYFGLGSMPIGDPGAAVEMIEDVCAQLGERALVCVDVGQLERDLDGDRIKIVPAVNHAAIFPRCRAIVHHGGSGTTGASVRAGVPTVVLWMGADQPAWAARITSLGVGAGKRFSATREESLLALLRTVLTPQYSARAREVARLMTDPAVSVATAATLIENAAQAAQRRGNAAS